MLKVSLEGDKKFLKLLDRYSKEVGQDVGESIVDMAKIGGRRLMAATEPYGLSGKARGVGEKAASKDIAKVYAAVAKVGKKIAEKSRRKAAIYNRYINEGKYAEAERLAGRVLGSDFAVGAFDDGAKHQESRDGQGQVREDAETLAVVGSGEIGPYHDKIGKRVGFAKAGWFHAMTDLGGKLTGIQKWIQNHPRNGTGTKAGRGMKTQVTLTNNVGYIRNILTPAKINRAIKTAMRSSIKRMEMVLAKAGKKFR